MGSAVMAGEIPPPPPGFVIGGTARPQAAQRRAPASAPRYDGPLPTDARAVFPALVAQESGGRAGVLGPMTQYGQAQGRTQMLPATARETAQRIGVPWRPELMTGTTPEAAQYQDQLGLAYFEQGLRETGNMRDALRYYHGGPNRSLWGPKTQAYSEQILQRVAGGQAMPDVSIGGQAQETPPPPPGFVIQGEQDFSTPLAMQNTAPIEVEIDQGVINRNGRAILNGEDVGSFEEFQANQRRSQEDREARRLRNADPQYQLAMREAQAGAANVPDPIRELLSGQTLGFGNEVNARIQGAIQGLENLAPGADRYSMAQATQAARDATRDEAKAYAAENPVASFGYNLAGGLLTPGLAAGGNYIAGAQGAARGVRAAQVGAGYGAAAGFGNAEGTLTERLPETVLGGLVGAGSGAIGQVAVDRLGRAAVNATPSPARVLSREGVDLTPAQLLTGVPVVGRVARALEQASSSIPLAGFAPKAAEQRSVASFDRTAINRALESIGETVPRGVQGREAIRFGDDVISARYQADLNPVVINPDPQINARIMAALNPRDLSRNARTTLNDAASDLVSRLQRPITGPEWKQIDSELSGLINTTASGDAASRPLSRALRDVRSVFGEALDNASPGALARVRETDQAFGNFQLIRRAASNPTTGRNDGLFTPSNLNSVLARSEGRAYGRGEGRLQEIVDPAEAVMAGTLNNSGTAERLAMITASTTGAGAATALNPAVAIPTIVGVSALYSRPAQAALNAVYRATDSRTANTSLQQLARLAQRNPALQPYYQAATEHVLSLGQTQSPATPPARSTAPVPTLAQ